MALYLDQNVFMESVSQVTATNSVELGTKRYYQGNEYLYVYNAGAAQISKGQLGFLPASSMSSGYSVSVTNAASQVGCERVVGVAHNATLPTGQYGWLATKGLVYIALDASEVSMNSGDLLAPGVDGGFVALAAATTNTSGLRVGLGVLLNSGVTTVGTAKAWFKSPVFG